MTPGETLRNIQAEMEADPTLSVDSYFRSDERRFYVEINSVSEKRTVQASSRRLK